MKQDFVIATTVGFAVALAIFDFENEFLNEDYRRTAGPLVRPGPLAR